MTYKEVHGSLILTHLMQTTSLLVGEYLSKRWSICSWAIKDPLAVELQRMDDNTGQMLTENEKNGLQTRPPRVFAPTQKMPG